jgi:hypothetical protein
MKKPLKTLTSISLASLILASSALAVFTISCTFVGPHPTVPPTKVEKAIFDVTTNDAGAVIYTPSQTTQGILSTSSTVANAFLPGLGGLISTGVAALLGLWAYLRGSKSQEVAGTLSQEIETILAFIQKLPNGQNNRDAIVTFIRQHQEDADVLKGVLSVISKYVDKPDAKADADIIKSIIDSMTSTANPVVQTATSPTIKSA